MVSHETIWFITSALLQMVHRHHASTFHRYGDMEPQKCCLSRPVGCY